jgi:hypothetical protein
MAGFSPHSSHESPHTVTTDSVIISLVWICLLLLVKFAAFPPSTESRPKLANVILILIATRMRRGIVHGYRLIGLARQYLTPSRLARTDIVFESPTVPFSYSN